jgi:hypothetical protein
MRSMRWDTNYARMFPRKTYQVRCANGQAYSVYAWTGDRACLAVRERMRREHGFRFAQVNGPTHWFF